MDRREKEVKDWQEIRSEEPDIVSERVKLTNILKKKQEGRG